MKADVPDLLFPITRCGLGTKTMVLVALKQDDTTKTIGTMTPELSEVSYKLQRCCLPLQQHQVFCKFVLHKRKITKSDCVQMDF